MSADTPVTAIVVAWNSADALPECLTALNREGVAVIVVDLHERVGLPGQWGVVEHVAWWRNGDAHCCACVAFLGIGGCGDHAGRGAGCGRDAERAGATAVARGVARGCQLDGGVRFGWP